MDRTRAGAKSTPGAESNEIGESLSPDEFHQVLQRAAAMQRAEHREGDPVAEGGPTLDLRELERIGVESGLSREAIQKAFVELRTGALEKQPEPTFLDKWIGPESISAQATSPLDAESARRRLEGILKGELLHPLERTGPRTHWEPTPGLWATLQRGVNLQGQSAWQKTQLETEVVSAKAGEQVKSVVKLEMRPGSRNGIYGGLLFLVAGVTAGVVSGGHAEGMLIGTALGAVCSGGVAAAVRSTYRRKLKTLRLAAARVLEKFST